MTKQKANGITVREFVSMRVLQRMGGIADVELGVLTPL